MIDAPLDNLLVVFRARINDLATNLVLGKVGWMDINFKRYWAGLVQTNKKLFQLCRVL